MNTKKKLQARSSRIFFTVFKGGRSDGTMKCHELASVLRTVGMLIIGITLFVCRAAAQQNQVPVGPNDITGFESLGTWTVRGSSSPPGFTVASTANRTQGKAAYSISNPPNLVKVISQPISSTATALTGIGNSGASLQIDVFLPTVQGNMVNSGYIQPYITSVSRGLSKVALAQVFFNGYPSGKYSTFGFPLPDSVTSVLNGGTFSDLVVEVDISSPGRKTGAYLLDNLRVQSVELPQSPTGQAPPPGYGGSVDLDAVGSKPDTQNIDLAPTQIPNDFRFLKLTDEPSVQLYMGLDGNPTTTCTYGPDPNDATGQSYILSSCTDGFQAGDLVPANWVKLAIVGGADTDEINAQLSRSPLGSTVGSALLPAMPTFWGGSDTCRPTPVPGTVVTTSPSCSNQTSQANQIITKYFKQVQDFNPAPRTWVVAPVPMFAKRHGNGAPTNNVPGGPPPTPGDPLFDDSGDLNPGGTFDAYWKLSGSLTPTAVPNTDENKTHFEATFTAHGVIFGEDVDVVDAKLTADTDSGQTTPSYVAASSMGTLAFYVFGNEIPSGGLSVDPSTGFSEDLPFSQEFDAPPIEIWIFEITLGATADAELKASASAALSGLDLTITPSASLGGHISGGINIGIASGGVDAKVNLVQLSLPVTAQAKWVLNTSPSICAATLNGSLRGDLNLSSGGGEVDLDATFGFCPFCYTDSETIIKWGPLASATWNLFKDTIDTQLFGLPASLCSFPITVNIVSPASGASLSSVLPISLTGSAKPNDSTIRPSSTTYTWTYTPGTNASTVTVNSGATGPNPNVTFGAPTSGSSSTWTIGLSATVTINGSGGTQVTSTASATPVTVTVTNLSNGVYIAQVASAGNGIAVPDSFGILQLGNVPGTITVSGIVVGASGTLNTTFTVAGCPNTFPYPGDDCATTGPATPLTTSNASSTTPSATWTGFQGGAYKITMTTTANGSQYGTASVVMYGTQLF